MKPSVVTLGKNERCLTVRELARRIADCTAPKGTHFDPNESSSTYLSRCVADLNQERERHARISVTTLERVTEILGSTVDLDSPLELAVLASYECCYDDVEFIQVKRYEGHKTLYEHALEKAATDYERAEHDGAVAAVGKLALPDKLEPLNVSMSPDVASATDAATPKSELLAKPTESNDDKSENVEGLTKRERQIRAIESVADELGYPRRMVPTGGKSRILSECKERYPSLFSGGDAPLLDAWKAARKLNRVAMAEQDKFSRR